MIIVSTRYLEHNSVAVHNLWLLRESGGEQDGGDGGWRGHEAAAARRPHPRTGRRPLPHPLQLRGW